MASVIPEPASWLQPCEETRAEFIAGLRALADYYESTPDLDPPFRAALMIAPVTHEAGVRATELLGATADGTAGDFDRYSRWFHGIRVTVYRSREGAER